MDEKSVLKSCLSMGQSEFAQTPSELRSQASCFLERAKSEADPQIKRGLASCAFTLSQLAESIELRRGEKRR
jgi:hypothetical protein